MSVPRPTPTPPTPRTAVRTQMQVALTLLQQARATAQEAGLMDTARSLDYVIDWLSVTHRKAKNDRPAATP